jgi:hypothetical protein
MLHRLATGDLYACRKLADDADSWAASLLADTKHSC